jgi:molecular chaperone GrpE
LKEDEVTGDAAGGLDQELPAVEPKELQVGEPLEESVSSTGDNAQDKVDVEPTLEERLADVEAKAAEYLDGWQRARAEFANARKRLERERAEAFSNAGVQYVTRLLPILDDLKRALDGAPAQIVEDPWFEGLDLVNRKFQSMMEAMDVRTIEALGQPFDPNLHEALSLREAEGVESGIVVEELQTGYRLGERVIRPALVNVSA